jgi:hypothetical protein
VIDLDKVFSTTDARVAKAGIEYVSLPVQIVYLTTHLEFEIALGGVLGWLGNDSGRYARETVDALQAIGAAQSAAIVQEMIAPFGDGPAKDDISRANQIAALVAQRNTRWSVLERELLNWRDDMGELLQSFIERHVSAFE